MGGNEGVEERWGKSEARFGANLLVVEIQVVIQSWPLVIQVQGRDLDWRDEFWSPQFVDDNL